jgi:DNA replication and repair protein RecF
VIVTSLHLVDFRNYERLELEPHPSITVLIGPNAIGKTNVIEALQVVTTTSSFRRPRWSDLVRWGASSGRVTLGAQEGERRLDLALTATSDNTREFAVNGQVKRRSSEVVGRLPAVIFTPDDLDLVKGPAERRRSAIDDLGSQLSPAYASLRRDYGKVVRHRNTLLKEDAPHSQIEPWDHQLASLGGHLLSHRARLLERVMSWAAKHYEDLASGEPLGWAYDDKCGLPEKVGGRRGVDRLTPDQASDAIAAEIIRRAAEERRRSSTLVGPHRDDVIFEVAGREARAFASQGQQRTIALAWKLAEVALIEEVLHTRPLLLLDDVMSELDASRREALGTAMIHQAQTFITATNIGYFDSRIMESASIVELRP